MVDLPDENNTGISMIMPWTVTPVWTSMERAIAPLQGIWAVLPGYSYSSFVRSTT